MSRDYYGTTPFTVANSRVRVKTLRNTKHVSLAGLGVLASLFYFWQSDGNSLIFLLGFSLYWLIQIGLPDCRLETTLLLSPANVALAIFTLQIVIIPTMIISGRMDTGTLPRTPTSKEIEFGYLINIVAFISYSVAFQFVNIRQEERIVFAPKTTSLLHVIFIAIGFTGILLFFDNFSNFALFVQDSTAFTDLLKRRELVTSSYSNLQGFLGNITRPFLGAGLILYLSMKIKPDSRRRFQFILFVLPLLVVVNFNYNRAYWVFPALACLAAFQKIDKRNAYLLITLAGVLGTLVLPVMGHYRVSGLALSDLTDKNVRNELMEQVDIASTVQTYAGGAQFTGFLASGFDYGNDLKFGATIIPSLLYPLPTVSDDFRELSGVRIYNRLIYGTQGFVDQVIPFQGELFINLHFFGVVIGFSVLAVAIKWLHMRFSASQVFFESYSYFFAGVWVAFLISGSLSVVSQIFFYFFWPIYLYFFLRYAARRSPGNKRSNQASTWHEAVKRMQ